MVPHEVVVDWVKNKKRIQDRLNRIKKRIKKHTKQLAHFEMRLRVIQQYEKEHPREKGTARQAG
jgi:hypothetical protein